MVPPIKNQPRKKETISIKTKIEMCQLHEQGMRVGAISRLFNRSTSTISTILKHKADILGMVSISDGNSRISKYPGSKRPAALGDVEEKLLKWIHDKDQEGTPQNEFAICDKAKEIYNDLACQSGSFARKDEIFVASRGWFINFKRRSNIVPIWKYGETRCAYYKTAPAPPTLVPLSSSSAGPSTSTFVPTIPEDPLSMLSVSYDQEQEEPDPEFEDITIKEEPLDHFLLEEDTKEELLETEKSSTEHEAIPQSVAPFLPVNVKEEAEEHEEADMEEEEYKIIDGPKIDSKFLELWNTKIPVPNEFWTVNKIDNGIKKMIVLIKLYAPFSRIPIIEKQMIIHQDMQFKWYIFSKEIGAMSFFSQEIFDNLMKHFDLMKPCYGRTQSLKHPVLLETSNFFMDTSLNALRHKICKYVTDDSNSPKKSCKLCSETIPQTITSKDSNSEDGISSKLWREKFKASQKEIKDLKETIDWLHKKCDEMKIPTGHTLVD